MTSQTGMTISAEDKMRYILKNVFFFVIGVQCCGKLVDPTDFHLYGQKLSAQFLLSSF